MKNRDSVLKRIAYVYVGTSNFQDDSDFYMNVLGARKVWEFNEFGAKVAAFDLCGEPYLLIADHVKAPSKRLIYEVDDLSAASATLKKRGWEPDGGRFEVPDGPCMNFKDRSGNEYALLEMSRPRILEGER
jgi:Glyoxalase/Bleomycin resistance protein/Dioxygenase superfamily